MRRLLVAAALCAAFLLLAAPALAGAARSGVKVAPAPHAPRMSAPAVRSFAPLGARLAGATATVSGHVYDSDHVPLSGFDMEWDSWLEATQTWTGGTMASQGGGSYSVTTAATSNGQIWAYPDVNTAWARAGQTWIAGDSYPDTDIYPGRVNVFAARRSGDWGTFGGLQLNLWGDQAYSYAYRDTADTSTSPANVQAQVMSGSYDVGSVNFWLDEGVEFSPSLTVTSGATPSGTISVNENGAQRVEPVGYKYSGKPGATISINRYNYPAGWRNYVTGYSDPSGTASKVYGTKVSQGGARESLSVKIPSTAKPGYSYWVGFQHRLSNGDYQPLYLETSYQVCTLKASKTKITRSRKIRATGIVPTQGHWKSQLGKRKYVYILWHKGNAGPTRSMKGWYRLAKVRCTGTGAYTSTSFRVPATGTLVAYYEGDDWYWGGYTSTVKITVK